MSKVRNWQIIRSDVNIAEALEILGNQEMKPYGHGIFAIQHSKTRRLLDDRNIKNEQISVQECDNKWMILMPNTDLENKNYKIRELIKSTNASGLTYDKIDNMTIDELWSHIIRSLNTDQKYRMIKLYIENNIFKKS